MTDRITHERAREIARLVAAFFPGGDVSNGPHDLLAYIDQQEKLATRPSPEPSSKPGELFAWHPIAESPPEHAHYLVWCADWGYEVQFFDGEFGAMGLNGSHDPTHWSALPPSPSGTCSTVPRPVEQFVPREPTQAVVDPMHPTGKCKCGGEGRCDWCKANPDPYQAADAPLLSRGETWEESQDRLYRERHPVDAEVAKLVERIDELHAKAAPGTLSAGQSPGSRNDPHRYIYDAHREPVASTADNKPRGADLQCLLVELVNSWPQLSSALRSLVKRP